MKTEDILSWFIDSGYEVKILKHVIYLSKEKDPIDVAFSCEPKDTWHYQGKNIYELLKQAYQEHKQ